MNLKRGFGRLRALSKAAEAAKMGNRVPGGKVISGGRMSSVGVTSCMS